MDPDGDLPDNVFESLTTADGAPLQWPIPEEMLVRKLTVPSQGRMYFIRYAFKNGHVC